MARIDAPMLDSIWIDFFHQLIFDIPQLARFMRHTAIFQTFNEAHVHFVYHGVRVETLPPTRTSDEMSGLRISCRELDWQLSSVTQVFTSFFPSIYMVDHLYIYGPRDLPSRWRDIENMQWLEIFLPFTAVKNLYLPKVFVPHIAPALQELAGGRVTEVLPILLNIYIEEVQSSGLIEEGIKKFVYERQLSGHPITVSLWGGDSESVSISERVSISEQVSKSKFPSNSRRIRPTRPRLLRDDLSSALHFNNFVCHLTITIDKVPLAPTSKSPLHIRHTQSSIFGSSAFQKNLLSFKYV